MIIGCIARHNLFGSEKSLSSTFGGKRCVAASIFLPPFAAGPSFSFLKMADASRSSDELEIVTEFGASHTLSDVDRLKLISYHKERPVLWDSTNIDKKHAKEEKLSALRSLEEAFGYQHSAALEFFWHGKPFSCRTRHLQNLVPQNFKQIFANVEHNFRYRCSVNPKLGFE